MSVPKIWLNILESNEKLLFFKINSIDSRINSLVKRCETRFRFLIIQYSIASRPSSEGIEVYRLSILQEYIALLKVKDRGRKFLKFQSFFFI